MLCDVEQRAVQNPLIGNGVGNRWHYESRETNYYQRYRRHGGLVQLQLFNDRVVDVHLLHVWVKGIGIVPPIRCVN